VVYQVLHLKVYVVLPLDNIKQLSHGVVLFIIQVIMVYHGQHQTVFNRQIGIVYVFLLQDSIKLQQLTL
jgi:hypothetical protein